MEASAAAAARPDTTILAEQDERRVLSVPRARVCLEGGRRGVVVVTRIAVGFVVPDVESIIKWGQPSLWWHGAASSVLSKAQEVARPRVKSQASFGGTTFSHARKKTRSVRCFLPSTACTPPVLSPSCLLCSCPALCTPIRNPQSESAQLLLLVCSNCCESANSERGTAREATQSNARQPDACGILRYHYPKYAPGIHNSSGSGTWPLVIC